MKSIIFLIWNLIKLVVLLLILVLFGVFLYFVGKSIITLEPPTEAEIATRQHQKKMEKISNDLESKVMLRCDQYLQRWAKYPETIDEDFFGMRIKSNPQKQSVVYVQQFTAANGFGVSSRFTVQCELNDGQFDAFVINGYSLN